MKQRNNIIAVYVRFIANVRVYRQYAEYPHWLKVLDPKPIVGWSAGKGDSYKFKLNICGK